MTVVIGIDVAKDKHDCFILSAEGEVLEDLFTISNTLEGFNLSDSCLPQYIIYNTLPWNRKKVSWFNNICDGFFASGE